MNNELSIARSIYEPKWLKFDIDNPPSSDCIVHHDIHGVVFAFHSEWDAISWAGHIHIGCHSQNLP